jgi:hypothetical protein
VSGGRRSAVIALKVARCLNHVDAGIVIIDRWACVVGVVGVALHYHLGGAGCWCWENALLVIASRMRMCSS